MNMIPSAGAIHLPVLGRAYFDLALQWSREDMPETVKEREEAIKALRGSLSVIPVVNGSRSIKTARLAIEEAVKALQEHRFKRATWRIDRGLGYCTISRYYVPTHVRNRESMIREYPGRPNRAHDDSRSILLPGRNMGEQRRLREKTRLIFSVSLAERLPRRIKQEVLEALQESSLNLSVSGTSRYNVYITDNPAKVGASVETGKDWDNRYSSGYAKTKLYAIFAAPRRYLSRVWKRHLSVVDGLMTLDAQPLDCKEAGIEIFRARWLEQSVGRSVKVVDGYIAITQDRQTAFHGKTYTSALVGLRRKLNFSDAKLAAQRAEKAVREFVARWKGKDFMVSVQDAKETGSCDFGIRSWCNAHDLPYHVGEAHIREVIEAYKKSPLPEARRAILHAWKRHQEQQAATAHAA